MLPRETERDSPTASEERPELVRMAMQFNSTIRLKRERTQNFKRPLVLPAQKNKNLKWNI